MKKSILLLFIIIATNLLAQKITFSQEALLHFGRIPPKTHQNILVDKLDRILGYRIKKDSTVFIGYLDKKGEVKISPIFKAGQNFYGGYANIIKDSIYGYVDSNGKIKLFSQYKKTYFYYGNVGISRNSKGVALIDREGNTITDFFINNSIEPYGDDYFIISKRTKILKVINSKGDIVFDDSINLLKTSSIINSKSIFQDSINGKIKQGLIHINGNIVLKAKYDKISGYYNEHELMLVYYNNKCGFVDKVGKEVIPIKYDKINHGFHDGIISILKDRKWGYINSNNEIMIPFIYDEADGFSEGLARVKKDGKYGFINKNNRIKIPFQLEQAKYSFFRNGRAVFSKDGKFGYLSKKGKIVNISAKKVKS